MFTAVAVILSWVYWLKGMKPGDEKNKGQWPLTIDHWILWAPAVEGV
jgi:hypothetical protein